MLVARGQLIYQNQLIASGELFQAAPIDAAVLRYRRKADFAPHGDAPVMAPKSPTPRARPGPDPEPEDLTEDPPVETERIHPPRRRYRRRDLTAEDP